MKPRKTHSADDLEKLMVGVAKNGAVRFSGVPSLSTAFVASARVALEGDGPQGTLLHLIPDRAASLACFSVGLKRYSTRLKRDRFRVLTATRILVPEKNTRQIDESQEALLRMSR